MFTGPLGPLDYVVIVAALVAIVLVAARAFGGQSDDE